MGHDVKGPLEATGCAGDQVGVIGDAYDSDGERTETEAKVAALEGEEGGVNVDFEMATGPDVALSVTLELCYPSAKLVMQLNVALGVLVGTSAVVQDITALTSGVEFP